MTTLHLILRFAHIAMGTLALLSGTAALAFGKGSLVHRRAGTVFFVSMLLLACTGGVMAIFTKPNMGNLMGAMMAFYLVATGWGTVVRAPGHTGRLEIAGALLGLAIAMIGITFGGLAASSPTGRFHAYGPPLYLIFASIALLGTVLDIRMIARGGLVGAARTARHLWRMCLGMFMATGSFFFGQPKFVPDVLRELRLVPVLALLPLVFLIYWMIRVRVWPLMRKGRGLRVAGQFPGA